MMLTDEELMQVARFELEPSPDDVAAMAAQLTEERLLMNGPTMPEVPSERVIRKVVGDSTLPGVDLMVRGFYAAIRKALLDERESEEV